MSQRQLRNNSGEIMRGLERGEAFQITNRGVLVGTLTPATKSALDYAVLRPGTQEMRFEKGVVRDEAVTAVLAELRGDR